MVPFARIAPALLLPAAVLAIGAMSLHRSPRADRALVWNSKAAATYLDSRTQSWMGGGAMDHGTFCISCHTALPYGLSRASMHGVLGEKQTPIVEQELLASITKRVQIWKEVQPYLGDKTGGLGSESVINALILAQEDARNGHLTETTREALKIMWSTQIKTGLKAGAWPWINAGNEPWEAPDSEYWGAALAAAATGIAPDDYVSEPQVQDGLNLLKAYLRNQEAGKSLFNRLSLLYADTKIPGLISASRRSAIITDVFAKQNPDGGWSTDSLIPATWTRHDGTAQETKSDGYGTGFVAYAMEQAGVKSSRLNLKRALSWLALNQDPATGSWVTESPNAKRNHASDVGKFMTDSATAYAVLALTDAR